EVGRDADGEQVLRDALDRSPKDGSLHHALGLLLVRQGRGREALDQLAEAARLDPANRRFVYVYAIALHDSGQTEEALKVLDANITRHPFDRDSLVALTGFYRKAGDREKAASYAKRLAELEPDDARAVTRSSSATTQ